jgi:hypothetical protein
VRRDNRRRRTIVAEEKKGGETMERRCSIDEDRMAWASFGETFSMNKIDHDTNNARLEEDSLDRESH